MMRRTTTTLFALVASLLISGSALAISADRPDQLRVSTTDLGLTYPIYSDAGLALARSLGIVFQKPGKSPLPVPAVYLLDAGGRILFQHVDPNFAERLDPSVILAAAATFGTSRAR